MKITVTAPNIVEKDLDVFGITDRKKMRLMMRRSVKRRQREFSSVPRRALMFMAISLPLSLR